MRRALAILLCLAIWSPSLVAASEFVRPMQRLRLAAKAAAENLIHSVDPVYPPDAREARITGVVVIELVVGRSGQVLSARVITGHPLFREAAANAVHRYRYKPFLLNGEPVEVVSTVGVRFASPPESSRTKSYPTYCLA